MTRNLVSVPLEDRPQTDSTGRFLTGSNIAARVPARHSAIRRKQPNQAADSRWRRPASSGLLPPQPPDGPPQQADTQNRDAPTTRGQPNHKEAGRATLPDPLRFDVPAAPLRRDIGIMFGRVPSPAADSPLRSPTDIHAMWGAQPCPRRVRQATSHPLPRSALPGYTSRP